MVRIFRVILFVVLLVGVLGLAREQAARAQPGAEAHLSIDAQDGSPAVFAGDHNDDGSVKPPPRKARICKKGNYSLGGVAIVRVKKLAKDYCLTAALWKRSKDPGTIPPGAGSILADITDVQFFYRNHRIGTLPEGKGDVEICYAIPPGKDGQIYFKANAKAEWKPLLTTFVKSMACAPAHVSGSYALIGR